MRELVREQVGASDTGWDLLLVARPEASAATYADLREALRSLLEQSGIGG